MWICEKIRFRNFNKSKTDHTLFYHGCHVSEILRTKKKKIIIATTNKFSWHQHHNIKLDYYSIKNLLFHVFLAGISLKQPTLVQEPNRWKAIIWNHDDHNYKHKYALKKKSCNNELKKMERAKLVVVQIGQINKMWWIVSIYVPNVSLHSQGL